MMKTGLLATFIAAVIMGGITWWTMIGLPETGDIPVHWNHKGEADRFAPVAEAKRIMWLVPGLSVLAGLLFAIGIKIDPRNKNIERSSRAYLAVWIGTLIVMTLVTALVCYSMLTGANNPNATMENMPNLIVSVLSVLFLVIGNYLPKTRSNWFFGVRTPWTLSSDEAWEKTHRLAGRLFIGLGLAGLLSVFLLPVTWQVPIIAGGAILITAITLVYSYLAWKNASDRDRTPDYIE